MRALSSVASIAIHSALGAAVLFGSTKSARPALIPVAPREIVFPPTEGRIEDGAGASLPGLPPIPALAPLGPLPDMLQSESGLRTAVRLSSIRPAGAAAGSSDPGVVGAGVGPLLGEANPEVLAGPLPIYPELLRHAGLEGRVVLQAVVDSSGRVQPASISVVFASNPGFVEPARVALRGTLFRPARVHGTAVSVLIRVPFAFTIRGTGRAR